MFTITESWQVIDKWLAEYAPVTLAKLNGPVDPAELAAAETRIGHKFPAELVESLSCHNGIAKDLYYVLPDGTFLSVAQIVENYELWMTTAKENDLLGPAPEGEEPWWHPEWIPFGDENGNTHVIDTRPGSKTGQFGKAFVYSGPHFDEYWGWPSLTAFLDETARALVAGQPVRQWRPYLIGTKRDLDSANGELTWSAGETLKFGKRILRPVSGGAAGDQA